MMIRSVVFEKIGLMDELHYLYFDNVDLCQRTRRSGWRSAYVPQSCVLHLKGDATGISRRGMRRGHWWYGSGRRSFVKDYDVLGHIAADTLWSVGRLSLVMRNLLRLGGSAAQDPAYLAWNLLFGDAKALAALSVWRIRREARP